MSQPNEPAPSGAECRCVDGMRFAVAACPDRSVVFRGGWLCPVHGEIRFHRAEDVNVARARIWLQPVPQLPEREREESVGSTGDGRWWCACDRGHPAEELRCEVCEMDRV